MFLTREQLETLTGYRQDKRIIQWLERNGVAYELSRGGRPGVRRSTVDPYYKPPTPLFVPPPIPPYDAGWIRPLPEIRATRVPYRYNMASWKCGVYFLFLRWALIYVGQSVGLSARLNAHRFASMGVGAGKRMPFNKVAMIEVPRHWLDEVENHYIATYKPPFNIRGIR